MRRGLAALIVACLWLFSVPAAPRPAPLRAPSGPLAIAATGTLTFAVSTKSTDQTIFCQSAPVFLISDATGSASGWNVTLTLSQWLGAFPEKNAPSLTFRPSGGLVAALPGSQRVDLSGGPRETDGPAVTLSQGLPVKAVSARPGFGSGSYQYAPLPSSFLLHVPAFTRAGTVTAVLAATVYPGP